MTTLNLIVGADADDGMFDSGGGTYYTTLSSEYIGNDSGTTTWISFARFTAVTIANAATINTAVLTLVEYQNISTTIMNVKLDAIAADNATAPTSGTDGVGRTRTTANVAWNGLGTWAGDPTTISAPDISTVIQELVNRAGWSSGNALCIYIEDNGSTSTVHRTYSDYTYSSSKAAKLAITYTPGSAAPAMLPTRTRSNQAVMRAANW